MTDANRFRQLVAARAGGACEYRRLHEVPTGVTFHLEHILPRSQGGATTVGNLAFSCPGCNSGKGDRTTGIDGSGKLQLLFNLRDFQPPLLG